MKGTIAIAADLWLAQRQGQEGLQRRARRRLVSLVRHARNASPYLRQLYRGLPHTGWSLPDLPPVTKQEVMAHFDDWVTDAAITCEGIEGYIADPDQVGHPYRDGTFVCTSSGTTGHPGIFVHDARATSVYWVLPLVRGYGAWFDVPELVKLIRSGAREAQVIGTGGHFGGVAWAQRARLANCISRRGIAVFGVEEPLTQLCLDIGEFQPQVLAGYPSALELLAAEEVAGRLHLQLMLAATSGETLQPATRRRITAAFGCIVRDAYAASETLFVGFGCREGWLHLSSDWFTIEPVEADGSTTPPGRFSHSVLVTNLANHLQPVIRYDLGDSVMLKPEPCNCGSPLPAFQVAGRSADALVLVDAQGQKVTVVPLLIGTAIDATPGAANVQVIQNGSSSLRVRFDAEPGYSAGLVWEELHARLNSTLAGVGLDEVHLDYAPGAPVLPAAGGKFRRIVPWSA